jgi:regulation of enolase protein 1 (concanavalin A-like superfamily)
VRVGRCYELPHVQSNNATRGTDYNFDDAERDETMTKEPSHFDKCRWINQPKRWRLEHDRLLVVTENTTDFWRETHYGFVRDSGHVFGYETGGDFTMEVRVQANYDSLYDQAGIMARLDERNWLKAGIERSDGQCQLSSVLTVDRSDWATGTYDGDPSDFRMRVTVSEGVIRVQVSADGKRWPLVRLAPFPVAASYFAGPMCCTPERAGMEVAFSDFCVGPPNNRDLHDLS